MANDDIQGQVVDQDGNTVANAVVALWKQGAPNKVITTQADSSGNYIFDSHPDGDGTSQNWHLAAYDPNDGSRQFPSLHSVSSQLDVGIPDGGVSYWSLDTDATDSWNNNHGTVNGASFVSDSERGDVVEYGSGDEIDIGATTNISGLSEFSISFWVKPTQASGIFNYLSKSDTPLSGNAEYEAVANNNFGGKEIRFETANDGVGFDKSNIIVDGWNHFVMGFEANTAMEFYHENTLRASTTPGDIPNTSKPLKFSHSGSGRGLPANSREDDIKIFNKRLSSSEVDNLYNTGSING